MARKGNPWALFPSLKKKHHWSDAKYEKCVRSVKRSRRKSSIICNIFALRTVFTCIYELSMTHLLSLYPAKK
jgi:hypothetical protein